MSLRQTIRKKSKSLKKQTMNQIKKKDGSSSFPTIIKKADLPAGVEVWYAKEGEHVIDIIPFVAGPDMPISNGVPVTEEGDINYVLDIMVHQNVGTMKQPYVCPWENFGEPCPICEYIQTHDLDKDTWKSLKAKRRVLYLVWVHNTREDERKGIQLLEISHFVMEEKLNEIAKLPRGGGAIIFSDIDEGKNVCFTRKGSGQQNTQYLGHKFVDRQADIPDKILDQSFSIDQVVEMRPTYDAMEEAFTPQKKRLDQQLGVSTSFDAGENFSDEGTGDDVPDWDAPEETEKPKKRKPKRRRPGSKLTRSSSKTTKKPAGKKRVVKKRRG